MKDLLDLRLRLEAWRMRRAVRRVTVSAIAPDPHPVFGVAPIRVAAEERVQAVAFGPLPGPARIVAVWNPLSREMQSLEGFAEALVGYVEEALREGRLPRVWLPHRAALEVLEVFGLRYRLNREASPAIRRLGLVCSALVEESRHPHQQAVVVAADLLRDHVVTGQSPTEEAHLGALLAWVDPRDGRDPLEEAARRSRVPAAALLERGEDDRVERLRAEAKRGGPRGEEARREIERILRRAAAREWGLLAHAWTSFWRIGLHQAPEIEDLVIRSIARLQRSLDTGRVRGRRPEDLAILLEERELQQRIGRRILVRADPVRRELLRSEGHVVRMRVVAVSRARTGRGRAKARGAHGHQGTALLDTTQPTTRLRQGQELETLDGSVHIVVERLSRERDRTVVHAVVRRGIRSLEQMEGSVADWVEAVKDLLPRRREAFRLLRDARPPLVYGGDAPLAHAEHGPSTA